MTAKIAEISVVHKPCVQKNIAKSATSLDTLAQSGTNDDFDVCATTNLSDTKTLLKRARRKHFTNGLVFKLVDSAKQNPDSVLTQSYWNSYHCSGVLQLSKNGKLTGKYCKCRWCMVCNAIRTAIAIRKYSSTLDAWSDSHFVTLTQKTVPFERLQEQLDEMQRIFKGICQFVKRKHQRGTLHYKLAGLRKLECTYRPHTNHYHPHYHVITETKEMADLLCTQWIKRNTNAEIQAQDVRRADSGSCKELFKYMTKVITDGRAIHSSSLDNIFNAFRGRRVLQPFGFRIPKEDADVNASSLENSEVIAVLEWQDEVTDWVNMQTGELLTGYTPPDAMKQLLK